MTKAPVRFSAIELSEVVKKQNTSDEGPRYWNGVAADYVNDRLDAWFGKNAVEVGGSQGPSGGWVFSERNLTNPNAKPTHRAYLVGIEPISRGVSKEEIVKFIKDQIEYRPLWALDEIKELADRIEREGIKP